MRYRVHIYATVRVPVDVEASSPVEAARRAENEINLYDRLSCNGFEYAEEIKSFLVDEISGEEEVIRSYSFHPDQVYSCDQPYFAEDGGE